MTLETLKSDWKDTPEYHRHIKELFADFVDKDAALKPHRDFIENNVFGMGERCFWWFWKLLCDELPDDASFIEIGCHKCATVSLWRILKPNSEIYGITPMDGTGTGWTQDDYEGDIKRLHDEFRLEYPVLHKGLSESPGALQFAYDHMRYTVLYIDGDHTFEGAYNDLFFYAPMVEHGGWLVIDDAACSTHQFFGEFQGIQPVCDALEKYMAGFGGLWEFYFNVVHLMIYKRV